MPIYEYRCAQCQYQFEKLQKMSDDPLVECPECREPSLTKLISKPGFRLKGEGWYETDFKTGNKRNLAESESKSESKSEGSSEQKTEKPKTEKPAESQAQSNSTPKTPATPTTTT